MSLCRGNIGRGYRAVKLGLTARTVETHVEHLLSKTATANRRELGRLAGGAGEGDLKRRVFRPCRSPVGDRTVITTERILPSDGLPDFAKSMVGETLKVTETQDWGPASADGSRRGTVEMAVAGAPIALNGTLAIAPGGPGAVEKLDAELKARIPLIGGKIEKAAAPPIEEAIDIEALTAAKWLKRSTSRS